MKEQVDCQSPISSDVRRWGTYKNSKQYDSKGFSVKLTTVPFCKCYWMYSKSNRTFLPIHQVRKNSGNTYRTCITCQNNWKLWIDRYQYSVTEYFVFQSDKGSFTRWWPVEISIFLQTFSRWTLWNEFRIVCHHIQKPSNFVVIWSSRYLNNCPNFIRKPFDYVKWYVQDIGFLFWKIHICFYSDVNHFSASVQDIYLI